MGTYFSMISSNQRRFWYIGGLTGDEFYLSDGMKVDINWQVYKELSDNGYRRIVFYNMEKRFYCYDEESFRLMRNGKAEFPQRHDVETEHKGEGLKKGKWGKKRNSPGRPKPEKSVRMQNSHVLMTDFGNGVLHQGIMDNDAVLSQIDAMMKNDSVSTAIVIDNADNFMRHLANGERWNNLMNDITKLNSENVNVMLFIFPDDTASSPVPLVTLDEFIERSRGDLNSINSIKLKQQNPSELCNMLNYFRLTRGLKMRVRELPEIAREIDRFIMHIKENKGKSDGIAEGINIKTLYHYLDRFAKSGETLTKDNCFRIFSDYGIKKIPTSEELLRDMTGMAEVKKKIIDKFRGKNPDRRAWLKTEEPNRLKPPAQSDSRHSFMHMVLCGNPGTGKTTVARLFGQYFADYGYLSRGHVVEVVADDLIAGYVGQTAIKTRNKVEEALGGVLFIDEAYSITESGGEFKDECISMLVKLMDTYKDNLIIVFAGYPEPMEKFMTANDGLKRRIGEFITIEDYTADELNQILVKMLAKKQLRMSDELAERMPDFFENFLGTADEEWGNAGEVEKLTESIEALFNNDGSHEFIGDGDERVGIVRECHIPESHKAFLKYVSEVREDAAEAINRMPGLHNVKAEIKKLENNIITGHVTTPGHYVFLGSPGTGKTTVARKMGMLFRSHNVLRRGHLVETSAEKLISGSFSDVTKKAVNGVLFIDEAYQLMNSMNGRDIVDSLVKFMEDNKERVCVILAGYEDDMNDMLREANEGLESRISRIRFDDYTGEELFSIFRGMIADSGLKGTDEYIELSHRAIVRYTELHGGKKGFGNARYIRDKYIKSSKDKLSARLVEQYRSRENIPEDERTLLTGADIPDELVRFTKYKLQKPDTRTVMEKIDAMVGLGKVKQKLHELIELAEFQQTDTSGGKPVNINLNWLLIGNAGTGKTTIAKLLGELYKEYGLLPYNRVNKVTGSQIIEDHVGGSAKSARNWIEKSMGGVLFIDEAYSMTEGDDSFGKQAIAEFTEAMTDHRGEFALVAAGYPNEMRKFLDANSGLSSRFDIVEIEDYSASELAKIFKGMCKAAAFNIDDGLASKLELFFMQYQKAESRTRKWNNAREAENLLQKMQSVWNRNRKYDSDNRYIFTTEHIPEEYKRYLKGKLSEKKKEKTAFEELDALSGLENLKEYFHSQKEIAEQKKAHNIINAERNISLHIVLKGNPGTGKTTVASLIGRLYKEIGLLSGGQLVKATSKDIISKYVRNTAHSVDEKVKEAMNGVLFIDEAYDIVKEGSGVDYGSEAVAALTDAMTENDGLFALVVAGYPKEMDAFLNSNSGFHGRFRHEFILDDYSDDVLTDIFRSVCEKRSAVASDGLIEKLPDVIKAMRKERSRQNMVWANGREMETLESEISLLWGKNMLFTEGEEGEMMLYTEAHIPPKYLSSDNDKKDENPTADFRIPEEYLPMPMENFSYPDNIDALGQGVVLIATSRNGNPSYGSGFLMTEDGYIITCAHVVDGTSELRVRFRIKKRGREQIIWQSAKIVHVEKKLDIALLKVEVMGFPELPMSRSDIKMSDRIFLLGYPFGSMLSDDINQLTLSLFSGGVSSIQKNNGAETVFINMEAKSGCSGAPVFSMETGEIVGILCGSQTARSGGNTGLVEEVNYIRPVKYIFEKFIKPTKNKISLDKEVK